MDSTREPAVDVERRIDGELRLVREAILMVASHGASRVVVAGLSMGAELLDPARRMALASGVRIVPLWAMDETHVDLRVEAIVP
jgi:hypothetical protein